MTSRYIFLSGTVAAILEIPRGLSGDQWGEIQKAFCHRVQPGVSFLDAWDGCYKLWDHCQHGPVAWDEELAGPGGMSFFLFPLPEATPADVKACVEHIRHRSDVVRLRVIRITTWITDFDLTPFLAV